jgi:hypothetical protein
MTAANYFYDLAASTSVEKGIFQSSRTFAGGWETAGETSAAPFGP